MKRLGNAAEDGDNNGQKDNRMIGILVLLLLAALAGVVYPYLPGARRWQFGLGALAAFLGIGIAAPNGAKPTNVPAAAAPTATPAAPSKPFLTIEPRALDAHRVELSIGTNVPTPIKVSTSIDLHGQKGTDTYVGYSEFVTLTAATTKVVLDTAKADKPLPASTYDATVSFFPKWGAEGNPAAAGVPELHAERQFRLSASGGSVADTQQRDERRRWIMENVIVGTPFDRAAFERQLGRAERGPSDLNLHDAFYYPGPGMTLLVNQVTHKVATWKDGNAIPAPNATRADFASRGLTWPLTVDRGWLGCAGDAVWFEAPDLTFYAVNGAAARQYRDIKPIWAENQQMMRELRAAGAKGGPTLRINIGDLIQEGRKLCG